MSLTAPVLHMLDQGATLANSTKTKYMNVARFCHEMTWSSVLHDWSQKRILGSEE